MCQSKAQGGKRCFAHNCAAEHSRAKKELKQAEKEFNRLNDRCYNAALNGEIPSDLAAEAKAAAETWEQKRLIERFSNPKNAGHNKSMILALLPEEYRQAASPVVDSLIAHQQRAAKAAGNARTERMFDRPDAAFNDEADEERSKAARLADGLRAAFYRAKTDVEEGMKDVFSGGDDRSLTTAAKDKQSGPGVFRSFLIETLEAVDETMIETAEGLAAGLGIEVADHPATPTKAAADSGLDLDQDDGRNGSDHGVDTDQRPEGEPEQYEPDEADNPEHQDADEDAADSSAPEKASTERRSTQPAEPTADHHAPQPVDARPAAEDGSVVGDGGLDRVHDPVGQREARGVGDRVEGQDQDHPTPTTAAVPTTDLGHRAASGDHTAAEHVPYDAGGGTVDHDYVRDQRSGDQVRGLDITSTAAEPQPADDLDYTAEGIEIPDDLSVLTDDELRALIDQLQARRA